MTLNITGEVKIFTSSTGVNFAKKMCDYLGATMGDSQYIRFSDGNIFVRVKEPVRNKDVYIVNPIALSPNEEYVELLFWIDAFKRASANSVTAIIPYFSYAKGDKKDEARVSIRARVCAECIELAGVDRVITMDLHSPQVQGFFKKPVDHLQAQTVLIEYVKTLDIFDNLVCVSPDAGFAKRVREFAGILNLPVAIGDKMRSGHDEKAKVMDLIGDIEGKDCLILDDFTISGGTLIDVANELKIKGAKRILACISHMAASEAGIRAIQASCIESLITTDTFDNPFLHHAPKVKVVSVAPLFAETVRRIHDREPVSDLFNNPPKRIMDW